LKPHIQISTERRVIPAMSRQIPVTALFPATPGYAGVLVRR
jgi:hypothetical protein